MAGDIGEVLGEAFDGNSVEPMGSFDPIEPGWYTLLIEKAEVKPTKKGDGKQLVLQTCVIGEKHNNRKVFKRINLKNPNSTCEEIGHRELAGLTLACGLATLDDSTELLDKTVEGKVIIKKEEGREPDNDIQSFRASGQVVAAQPTTKTAPTTTKAAPAAKVTPPSEPKAPATTAKPKRPWDR